jgi:hypothetical protein
MESARLEQRRGLSERQMSEFVLDLAVARPAKRSFDAVSQVRMGAIEVVPW